MRITTFLPAIIWFIVATILLSIPGDNLPQNDLFDIPNFDKIVHLGIFFLLTATFSFPFIHFRATTALIKSWFVSITLYSIAYGIIMEFVQKYLVYGRSFDITDVYFDALGSVMGLIAIMIYYHKKIGPDGNQGRNQN